MLLRICLCLAAVTATNGASTGDRDFATSDLLKFVAAEAVVTNTELEEGQSGAYSGESKRHQTVVAPPQGFLTRERSARRLDAETQGYGWEEEARQPRRRNSDGAEYDSQGNRVRHPKTSNFDNLNFGFQGQNRRQQQYRRPQGNVYKQGRQQAKRLQQAERLQALYPQVEQQRIRRQPQPEAEPAFQKKKANTPRILRPVNYQPESPVAPAFNPKKETQRTLRPVEKADRPYRNKPKSAERTFKKTKAEQSERVYRQEASDISERRAGLEGEPFQPRFEPRTAPAHAYESSYGGPPEQRNLEAAVAAGAAGYNSATYSEPQRLQFQIHGQGGPNSYRFGYDTGHGYNRQFRYEERDDHGVLHGRYGYYLPGGKLQIVNYTADPVGGFHAEGDHVPKPQY